MSFRKLIIKILQIFSDIYYRFRYKALFLSRSLIIVKSKISISGSTSVRGSLILNNTICRIADKSSINRTAVIDFCGGGISDGFICPYRAFCRHWRSGTN